MRAWAVVLALFAPLTGCGAGDAGGADRDARSRSLAFTDVTAESGIDFATTSGATPATQILEVKGGGLALFDPDGDGDLDLLVPNGATLASPERGPGARLFANESGLSFRDVTRDVGLDYSRWGMGVAVGDVDGDGWEDVFIAGFGANALLRNTAGKGFEERTAELGLERSGWGMAAAFGDLDLDGDLDLYLVNYLELDPRAPPPAMQILGVAVFPGPLGYAGEADVLYENRSGAEPARFVDVTREAGCAVEPGFGLGAVILDFDADGRQDVFVGNDSQANFLFHNRTDRGASLRFVERGVQSGVAFNTDGRAQATMGIAVADVDGNGLPDVFTTNFALDTNTLHLNRGDLSFADRTQPWGLGLVSLPFLGWAAMFYDFDRDADEDLLAFNGHVYPDSVTAQLGMESLQEPLLFEREAATFRRVGAASAGEWLAQTHRDRAAAFGDLDGDGDVDVVVGELGGPLRVLRNDAQTGHWLTVELRDRASRNPRALGARIELRTGDGGETRQVRWVHSGAGYQSASDLAAYFGLGAHSGPVVLDVLWPDGARETRTVERVDQRLVVERE